jgi:hemoglobin
MAEISLYERLGGYDTIAGITDSFLDRLANDPDIGYYWAADSLDTKRRDRQLIVDFLCEAAGGPTFYTGRDMKTSHEGLGITDAEYDNMLTHCRATLDEFELPQDVKSDVGGFIESLRPEIVVDT